jgi:hypothetical protein
VTAGVGGELLPEGKVFQNQGRPRPQHAAQRPDQQKEQKPSHWPTLARPEIINDFHPKWVFADYDNTCSVVLPGITDAHAAHPG